MTGRMLTILLTSIALGGGGQLLFKAGAKLLPPFEELCVVVLLLRMFSTPLILGAFSCFLVSTVLWVVALRTVPLSVAYPMVALSYIIIFTGSYFIFGEPLSWRHWIGAGLIVSGIVLINWPK